MLAHAKELHFSSDMVNIHLLVSTILLTNIEIREQKFQWQQQYNFKPFHSSDLIDFTLYNARGYLLVKGRPLGSKRVKKLSPLTPSCPRVTN